MLLLLMSSGNGVSEGRYSNFAFLMASKSYKADCRLLSLKPASTILPALKKTAPSGPHW